MRQVRSDRLSLGSLPDFKYFRAGFRDMPALAAAIVNVFSFFRNFISLLICWSVTMLAMIQISSEKAGSSNCRPGPILRVVDQLILEVGDEEKFVSRTLADAPDSGEKINEQLLDGQQRLTALSGVA